MATQDVQSGDRERAGARARRFFDDLWMQGDYWRLETSEFDQTRYARSLRLLGDRRYARTLEIGCGTGAFTGRLASMSDRIMALDVSSSAIARARERGLDPGVVEFREANIMDGAPEAEGPCLNVGFRREHEEMFHGVKDGVQLEALITLLQRPVPTSTKPA